ncbi:MAG: PAS domain S-box protein [Anaerolineae bacterium]|nr:PAS domain S-box protein [Anaerolineae bacterium]
MEQDLEQRIRAVEKRLEDLPAEQQEDFAGLRDEFSAILAEIREAGEALRRQREKQVETQMANNLLRSLLDVMPVGVIVCDGDGTVLMNNPAAKSILDGGLAGDVHHPARVHTTYRLDGSLFPVEEMPLVQTLKTGQVVKGVEILVRWPDGRERAILAGAAPVTDDTGDIVSAVAVFQDITAHKQAEEEIKCLLADNCSQRELLERLIDQVPVGIAIVRGPDHRYEMVTPYYQAASGVPGMPMVGHTIAEVFPDIVTRGALEFIETVYRTGQTVSIRERETSLGPGREQTYWNVDHVPLRNQEGDVESVLILTSEVTEQVLQRKQMEDLAATVQSERNILQVIMENTPAHLAYLDPEFNFVEVNSTYVRGCGHSREALIGHNHFERFPDEENQAIFEHVRDIGEPVKFHAKPFEFPDHPEWGTTYWDWTLTPVKNENGEIQGLAFSLFDVTEQMRAQAEIENLSRFPGENPNPVLRMAKDGTILYANAGSAFLLSCCDARVGEKGPAEWQHHVAKALDAGEVQVIEAPCDERIFSLTIAPITEKGYANLYGLNITTRKQAEEALRASEERLRLVADYTHDWEYWTSPNGEHLYISPACERITGYPPKRFYDDPDLLRRIVHPNDQFILEEHLHESHRAHQVRGVDFRIVTRDGRERWINHVCQPVYNAAGVWLGYRSSNRDVTDRKQAEQSLSDREQKLRALFDILPIGVSILDDARHIQLSNPVLAKILDLSPEQLQTGEYEKRTYLRSDGSEMSPDEFPSSRAFREQQPIHDVEIEIVKRDGDRIWTDVSAVPLPFADWRVIITTADITRQKQAEAALRQARDELEMRVRERTAELLGVNVALRGEIADRRRVEAELRTSEERFRQVAENIDEILWLAEPGSGRLLYINPAYEKIRGRSVGNLPENAQEILADVHPEDRQQLSHIREGQGTEFRIIRPNGDVRWVRARVFPIQDESGQLYRLVGIAEDITEQKQTLAALLGAERLAGAGKMAAFLAHEINNPLQSAVGCLNLALEQLEKGDDASEYLTVTFEALQRTSRIVKQLRNLHRRVDVSQNKEMVDLNALLRNVLVLTQKKCQDCGVEVILATADDLPMLEMVLDAIQQVFLNLVLNALDAMPEGGQLQVRVSKTTEPYGVQVAFVDVGTGISAEEQMHIFEPFYTTKRDSLGVGLFISRDIVQQHDGRIEVQSQEGEGTTFTVWLPA